jgi:aminopeptidase N
MKYFIAFILICLTAVTIQSVAQQSDGAAACAQSKARYFGRIQQNTKARVAYPGDENIDVNYYKLNLILSTLPNNLVGEVTIAFKPKSNSNTCILDLSSVLKTDSVKIDGRKVVFVHANNKLNITFLNIVLAGQNTSVMVYYHGLPSSSGGIASSFAFAKINNNKSDAIWSLSEPYGASDWFPCKDNPADKADSSDVWITAPAYFVSVSNGVLEKVLTNNDGTKTYRWRSRYPIANYLISIACSNYSQYNNYFKYSTTDSMLVSHYVQRDNLTNANKAILDKTVTLLELFTEKLGPYPFLKEKYGHAEFGVGGGMEHQTCTSLGGYSTNLIAHELTHQWFGDKITCQNWAHIWLNEGFATYGEALWAEFQDKQFGYQAFMNGMMTNAKTAKGSVFVVNAANVNQIFDYNRTYSKGATVLYMLRGVVGDAVFFKILKTYTTSKFAYGNATTEDFQAIAEAVYGQSLDYFFKEWIYGENYPNYTLDYAISLKNNLNVVTATVKQAKNTTPSFFTMPILFKIKTNAGDTVIVAMNDKQEQTFVFEIKNTVQTVTMDPNSLILKNLKQNQLLSNNSVTEIDSFVVYPNPSTEWLTIEFQNKTMSHVKIELLNVAGRLIKTLANETRPAGKNTISSEISSFPAGVYIVRLEQNGVASSQKIVIL